MVEDLNLELVTIGKECDYISGYHSGINKNNPHSTHYDDEPQGHPGLRRRH